jgi:BirA family biotin operon repressor/biotin-[acetyl-CoA-carboxylase] ligase
MMRLDPAAVSAGVRLASYDVIGSTNTEALARAGRGERGPLWITARAQTAGRGRHGRVWVSEPGNLYASLLLSDPAPPALAPQLALVAALAVHDAVAEAAPALRSQLRLKWPNDLVVEDAKLAGTLIEGAGAGPLQIAVGVGINCRHHPEATSVRATDLGDLGSEVTAEAQFAILTRTMVERLRQWDRGTGFAGVRADWLERTGAPGHALRVRINSRIIEGRFHGLDGSGRLLVRRGDGTVETVSAGDVFPLALGYPSPQGEGRNGEGEAGRE